MSQVSYLMYHEIGVPNRALCNDDPGYTRYVVDEPLFRAQIGRLGADGLHGLAVGEALARDSRSPGVVITFDDGCETDLTVAAPLLRAAGFGATFYVTVEHLGRRGYLSRGQLAELAGLGFEIGSHAMTHRYLHDLEDAEVTSELVESKRELEAITGKPVAHFSCPGGRWDRRVSEAARAAGYASLVTSAIGRNSERTSAFKLHRVAVMRGMSAADVARIGRGRGILKRRAQSGMLDLAKHVLGNRRYEEVRGAALRTLSRVR